MAFGKRVRIANAITDLRRPPSIEYLDHQLSPTQLQHSNSLTHSRSRTQSQSTSATTAGHVHWGSFGAEHDGQQPGHLQDSPVNIDDDMKAAGSVDMGGDTVTGAGISAAAGVGLGIVFSPSEVSSFTNLCTYVYI